jgi:hypothetical protein
MRQGHHCLLRIVTEAKWRETDPRFHQSEVIVHQEVAETKVEAAGIAPAALFT